MIARRSLDKQHQRGLCRAKLGFRGKERGFLCVPQNMSVCAMWPSIDEDSCLTAYSLSDQTDLQAELAKYRAKQAEEKVIKQNLELLAACEAERAEVEVLEVGSCELTEPYFVAWRRSNTKRWLDSAHGAVNGTSRAKNLAPFAPSSSVFAV